MRDLDIMSVLEGLREMIAGIVGEEIPKLALMGAHSYRVTKVRDDGRCDLEAMKKGPPATIPNVDHWCGIPGGAGRPVAGSIVVVTFLDGEKNAPMVGAYQPLRADGGKPGEVTIDGVIVKIGPTANTVRLAGGSDFVALASLVNGNITAIETTLTAVAAILNLPGPVVGAASAVPPFVASSVSATKVYAS